MYKYVFLYLNGKKIKFVCVIYFTNKYNILIPDAPQLYFELALFNVFIWFLVGHEKLKC